MVERIVTQDFRSLRDPLAGASGPAAEYSRPVEGELILNNFKFRSGDALSALRIHYRTLGQPRRDANGVVANAVLILHGTGGSGLQFMAGEFAGELFGRGQPLDVGCYFVVLPDAIGHGQSSRPSDGLRAGFPHYGYRDMIAAQHRLLTQGLQVEHLRLVLGTSMGGMHTWLWGEDHPDFMDALLPLASLPTQICGRNRIWRRIISDAIRNDPDWHAGEYRQQPPSLRTAAQILFLMGGNPLLRCQQMPSLSDSDSALDAAVAVAVQQTDANDLLYQIEASRDYDPGPRLERIRTPLLAINWADDLINPPELAILEREIRRVAHGRAILMPVPRRDSRARFLHDGRALVTIPAAAARGRSAPMTASRWRRRYTLTLLGQSVPHR